MMNKEIYLAKESGVYEMYYLELATGLQREKKGEFFKSLKEGMNENLEKKRILCEKAEALKDSTDWKTTAEELTKLQKEWKTALLQNDH